MSNLLRRIWPFGTAVPDTDELVDLASPAMARLVADLHYEIVPLSSIEQAIDDLPPTSRVSVTCSPTKGIGTTLEYCDRLIGLGHSPIPHLAARMVESVEHAGKLATWLRERDLREVFVIAGDAPEPAGPYEGALAFIRDLLAGDPGVERVGITGYPDGHALVDQSVIDEQLHAKQALLREFGVGGWISTQMCFDETKIRQWLDGVRAAGVDLPVRLGIPGVVDRTRLMTMGTRLGIGTSLRYLSKNRSTVMHLLAPGGFDPTDTVIEFAKDADRLGIEALHSFTFNAVAETRAWQEAILEGGAT